MKSNEEFPIFIPVYGQPGYTADRMNLMDQNHRLVHLDLKGAPPRVEYLEQVIPLFKKLGATGLLIEYEDMFPYYGDLEEVASQHAYSKEAIYRIQQLAEENSLIIIPLVQSFGHFEFVLKHEKFRSLREVPNYPMALCPSNPDSLMAVCMMIDQVMELHQGLRWFHIGADEVYHIGICDKCKKRMHVQNLTQQQLFFSHCKAVLNYIKVKYPSVTAIMWDDMLRHTELPVLLGKLTAIMWDDMLRHTELPVLLGKLTAIMWDDMLRHTELPVLLGKLTAIMWDDMLRHTELPVLLGKLTAIMWTTCSDIQNYLYYRKLTGIMWDDMLRHTELPVLLVKLTAIMWDDMLRHTELPVLLQVDSYNVGLMLRHTELPVLLGKLTAIMWDDMLRHTELPITGKLTAIMWDDMLRHTELPVLLCKLTAIMWDDIIRHTELPALLGKLTGIMWEDMLRHTELPVLLGKLTAIIWDDMLRHTEHTCISG
ncbi:HEX [Mytilus edulis]|uniref:beta-N-acetylhexosaminidase n=1 Tax=Mytilus edulis TaxID=6550 RepID=A0A8S3UNS3_MYTED|nr:HEX [Mytilus edulis]